MDEVTIKLKSVEIHIKHNGDEPLAFMQEVIRRALVSLGYGDETNEDKVQSKTKKENYIG